MKNSFWIVLIFAFGMPAAWGQIQIVDFGNDHIGVGGIGETFTFEGINEGQGYIPLPSKTFHELVAWSATLDEYLTGLKEANRRYKEAWHSRPEYQAAYSFEYWSDLVDRYYPPDPRFNSRLREIGVFAGTAEDPPSYAIHPNHPHDRYYYYEYKDINAGEYYRRHNRIQHPDYHVTIPPEFDELYITEYFRFNRHYPIDRHSYWEQDLTHEERGRSIYGIFKSAFRTATL